MSGFKADIAIIGGGVGGCAAALAAARAGKTVVMTEETDWIGGQLTAQAVPPDENHAIENYGGTALYREYRTRVRDYYRRNYPLTEAARAVEHLNPGNGGVSRLCHEPRISVAALEAMLAPYVSGKKVTVLLRHKPVVADADGNRVRSVTVKSLDDGDVKQIEAAYFLDATELGTLLHLTGTEYVTGFESRAENGEAAAPDTPQPHNMQAFTCCFAMDYLPGENHVIDKPSDYEFWRDYVPDLTPPWPGRLLSLNTTHPHTLEPRTHVFDPAGEDTSNRGLWLYRRIADQDNFVPGTYPGDICLVNWPQNDYLLGNLFENDEKEAAAHLQRGKDLSLSLLYWLQTEAPRPDGGMGWPGLRLRKDVVGTEDGLAKYPYVRESRRIKAVFTVTGNHIGLNERMAETGSSKDEVRAMQFADTVGIGLYRIDLHPSSGGDNYIDVPALPFQIPLGALVPVRMDNLLPACKNLGVTHIANGCYRLHPVEWNIGEAAGALAAFCLDRDVMPRQVHGGAALLGDFQKGLADSGVTLAWPG